MALITEPMSSAELEAQLRRIGAERYHSLHPFHDLLHSGQLSRGQIQAWALNRYYYQANIPVKDAALLSRLPDPDSRRNWRQRLADHDGDETGAGGVARWLILTDCLGLDRDYVLSTEGILPATRFAVDAYIHFCRERPVVEAVAASLTEMFSPGIIAARVAGLLAHYPFISRDTLAYFDHRPNQARRDADFALSYVKQEAVRPDQQAAVLKALIFKCDLLWAQLDALYSAYVAPGHVPPGAFRPEGDH